MVRLYYCSKYICGCHGCVIAIGQVVREEFVFVGA
jgi:hypothetical protein